MLSFRGYLLLAPFINPFSNMTHFHVHFDYYSVILYSFRNFMRKIKIVKTAAINLLTSIDPS
ncbi:hypothetical protein E2C01_042613 [Portunus trituberculatus]|uniref:Uncharacterized protein n=1 Tax=Portunus trituberculatus TaxID=210409 RepID=A0A5B7FVA0_PORTR|nr:hypothetical protein [Portunus trituberculatus]